ncbi:TonB-dependent receptor [Haliscomenobacter sp.]|uniref:TonB-dependent receptor n=1 Tax=Haliscomenobacter sp. TaxID=2717303 RepID=UPI0033651014
MKNIFVLLIFLCFAFSMAAQTTQLRGKVLDAATNAPLAGANVQITGGGGTITDQNGNFAVPCNGALELSVSFIGYETERRQVKNCGEAVNFSLELSASDLNTVEITATSSLNKSVLYQPFSIAKLGETEIKRSTGLLLDDAINVNIPGVFMERRTFSAGQQFNIRGYGNGARGTNGVNSNFDGQGSKVYLNGIPLTDAEGITLMDDIDFGSIGNVEVVKGPAGSLYGLAIAGVVNLNTIKPTPGQSSFGQDLLVGSYGLRRYTTHLQIAKERASFLVNYGRQTYDGFMKHTASNKDFVNALGEFHPNSKQSINTYFGFSNSYDQRNGELTKQQYETFDYSGNPAYIKNNAHSNVTTFRTGVSQTYRFNQKIANTTALFGTGLISNVSSAGGWTDKSSVNYGFRSTFDTKFSIGKGLTLTGITGAEGQIQNAQTLGYPMIADSFNLTGYNIIGTLRSNQYTISRTISAFSEWTLTLPADFSLSAGLGYSVMGIELNDRFYVANNNNPRNPNGTNKPSQYKAEYNNLFSPRFTLNKVLSKRVSVYASYSKGYKAPVSSYFFIPVTGEVVRGLKPEIGTQYEIGTKGSLWNDRFTYQIAGFSAIFSNKMTTVAVPNARNTATSYVYVVNGGQQKNQGIEIALRAVVVKSETGFLKSLSPFANFTYSNFKYEDFKFQQLSSDRKSITEVDFSNKTVAGVPPVTFNLGFDLETKAGLYANMTYSYRDPMYYTSDNVNKTAAYSLLNAKVGFQYPIGTHLGLNVYAGANNISGQQYYNMVFLNQLPDAYLPGPNKSNFFGGLQVKYIL